MKFKIKREILLEGLNEVSKALSTKNIIPILAGIKFELSEDGLNLITSDNNITIKKHIYSKEIESIDQFGIMVINGKYILEIVRKIQDDIINLEILDGTKIKINTENSIFYLNSYNSTEYPEIFLEESKSPIIMDKNVFKNIVNQTVYAVSTEETRPLLTGINFKIEDGILDCTATDSYRLAKRTLNIDQTKEKANITVPGKNLLELIKIIDEKEGNIEIHIFNNKILFKFDEILFQSRLLNGTYPDVSKLIPEKYSVKIKTNHIDIYNVIDRASLLTTEKEKQPISLETTGDLITIRSNSPEIGKVEERLRVKKEGEGEIKISFSSKYILDAIKAIPSEQIEIYLISESDPIIIKTTEIEGLIQLLSPIRTY